MLCIAEPPAKYRFAAHVASSSEEAGVRRIPRPARNGARLLLVERGGFVAGCPPHMSCSSRGSRNGPPKPALTFCSIRGPVAIIRPSEATAVDATGDADLAVPGGACFLTAPNDRTRPANRLVQDRRHRARPPPRLRPGHRTRTCRAGSQESRLRDGWLDRSRSHDQIDTSHGIMFRIPGHEAVSNNMTRARSVRATSGGERWGASSCRLRTAGLSPPSRLPAVPSRPAHGGIKSRIRQRNARWTSGRRALPST